MSAEAHDTLPAIVVPTAAEFKPHEIGGALGLRQSEVEHRPARLREELDGAD